MQYVILHHHIHTVSAKVLTVFYFVVPALYTRSLRSSYLLHAVGLAE